MLADARLDGREVGCVSQISGVVQLSGSLPVVGADPVVEARDLAVLQLAQEDVLEARRVQCTPRPRVSLEPQSTQLRPEQRRARCTRVVWRVRLLPFCSSLESPQTPGSPDTAALTLGLEEALQLAHDRSGGDDAEEVVDGLGFGGGSLLAGAGVGVVEGEESAEGFDGWLGEEVGMDGGEKAARGFVSALTESSSSLVRQLDLPGPCSLGVQSPEFVRESFNLHILHHRNGWNALALFSYSAHPVRQSCIGGRLRYTLLRTWKGCREV